jgi:hypothetical protein
MLWRDMRGRTKEIHKELQDLDPICSPHLGERWIGGNIDLDLPSLFPQRYARIMGGIERGASFPRSNNGRESKKEATSPRGKKGAFYRSPHEIRPLQPF